MNILFLSHSYWDSLFRVGSHHLAEHLAQAGHTVLYISTPVTPLHYLKFESVRGRMERAGKLQHVMENLYAYVPRTIIPSGLLIYKGFDVAFAGRCDTTRQAKKIGVDNFDLVLVDDPKLIGLLRFVSYTKLVYRPTDIYSQMGLKNWRQLESHLLDNCDAIVATSGPVLSFLNKTFDVKKPGLVLVNGVDYETFSTPQPCPVEYEGSARKKCVYVGALDFRFDFDALLFAARSKPDVDFYVIGIASAEEVTRFNEVENLHFLGSRPYHQVPAYLQHADVGLLLLLPTQANMGRSPMKLYEYLAAGIPVVALKTDELQRRKLGRVFCYDTNDSLVVALTEALQEGRESYFEPNLSWRAISQNMLNFVAAEAS
ncbi:MAG: glycosyltransferase family 1 protein [Verrucomicrobiaceae bacterium]|nr:glycosyltransferase family 1 protein [Verrucomicrobiaceae bacterium]